MLSESNCLKTDILLLQIKKHTLLFCWWWKVHKTSLVFDLNNCFSCCNNGKRSLQLCMTDVSFAVSLPSVNRLTSAVFPTTFSDTTRASCKITSGKTASPSIAGRGAIDGMRPSPIIWQSRKYWRWVESIRHLIVFDNNSSNNSSPQERLAHLQDFQ